MMKRIWEWLKKFWQILVWPFWGVTLMVMWAFNYRRRKDQVAVTVVTEEPEEDRSQEFMMASEERKAAIQSITRAFEEKLLKASNEQLQDAEKMKGKSLKEIAEWIDTF